MFSLNRGPSFNRPSIYRRPDSHTCFFLFIPFVYLEDDVAFFRVFFVPLPLSLLCMYGEYVVRSFLPNGVFLPCDHGLDFGHQLM